MHYIVSIVMHTCINVTLFQNSYNMLYIHYYITCVKTDAILWYIFMYIHGNFSANCCLVPKTLTGASFVAMHERLEGYMGYMLHAKDFMPIHQ